MMKERIAWLKDKLKSWPGEMALTSEDVADLLAMLDENEKVKAERSELLCERDEARVDRDILKAELARVRPLIEATKNFDPYGSYYIDEDEAGLQELIAAAREVKEKP